MAIFFLGFAASMAIVLVGGSIVMVSDASTRYEKKAATCEPFAMSTSYEQIPLACSGYFQ